ncbi:uncharacterized protein SCHCODRAFT_02515885 [Schizophyllum commune H4-8]|uniref:uncharacterized protein n=1 Tax=Schizophyllum commune (strain H4-8 / FGSC 9210) TaxID=578458 RepID=UPI00215E7CCF|nr:uncharacterized protein SCHCODRAFT_02515885 [Schizophyllum commune H4-8]KAI5887239.1 hypothetical protein SCHCODRAFT_02515885 [Schizophyllum commune H4-8]
MGLTEFGSDALSRLFVRTVILSSSPVCPGSASEAMEPALPNVLPPELLYKVPWPTVFTLASEDLHTNLCLLLVCHTAHDWVLPLLYNTISLSSHAQIVSFFVAHDTLQEPHMHRLRLVRNLWLGPQANTSDSSLFYGSNAWPLTIIHRILYSCTNVESLYLINLDQNEWFRLENVIPSSVKRLAMGPVHGPFILRNLNHCPHIESFTSALSFMRDDEVKEIVTYPHMREFRRILQAHPLASVSDILVDQLPCVSASQTLESMRFEICGPQERAFGLLGTITAKIQERHVDARITASRVAEEDWMAYLHHEFLSLKNAYVCTSTGVSGRAP